MQKQIRLSITIRFIIYFIHWMVLAHLPVLLFSYGISDIEIGTLIGLFALSSMALMLPMGAMSDFFSPKRTILIGTAFFFLYFLALLLVRSFYLLLPAVIIGGFGAACLVVVSESLYLKLFCQEKRGARVALYQISTYLGFGLGPLAGGFLIGRAPEMVFGVAATGALIIFILGLFLQDFAPIDFGIKKYGKDIFRPKPMLLFACIFVIGTHFGVEQTSISLLMTEDLDFSPMSIGWLFAGLGIWMAAVVPFIGKMHDRRGTEFLYLLGGLCLSGIFQVATAYAYNFWSLMTIRIAHTLGDAFALFELSLLIAVLFPSQRLGGNAGLLYAIRTLATFSAAVLAGVINKQWGYGASFMMNGVFVLLFAGSSILFILGSGERIRSVGWHDKKGNG